MPIDIETNYDRTVIVQRLADDDSGVGETYAEHISSYPCHIQPLDDSFGEDLRGNFGKDWLMFGSTADILENDRIIDGATEYRVVSVEKFHFLGEDRHTECRIRKSNP